MGNNHLVEMGLSLFLLHIATLRMKWMRGERESDSIQSNFPTTDILILSAILLAWLAQSG